MLSKKSFKTSLLARDGHSSDNDIWTQYPSGLLESEPEQNGLPLPSGYHAGRTRYCRVAGSGRAIPTIRFSVTFSGSEAGGTSVESQKDPPYLLSAETEFSP